MLTKRMCLVLGAGASSPYGFPTGGELLSFANSPDDDWWPIAARLFSTDKEYHAEFVQERRASGAESLDEFVGRQTVFKNYALALIAYKIGACESRSSILGATNSSGDWMTFFIRRLVDGVNLEDLKGTNLSVVTFNFDRCFEETLLIRLSATYKRPGESDTQVCERVAEAVRSARWPFVHVHGSLGPLAELAGGGRAYERTANPDDVRQAAQRLILLDDAQEDSPEFQTARKYIYHAELVVFLGFGFHRLNCKRVLPPRWGTAQPIVRGTVQGMSFGKVEKAKQYFLPGPTAQLANLSCLDLLRNIEHDFSD